MMILGSFALLALGITLHLEKIGHVSKAIAESEETGDLIIQITDREIVNATDE